MDIPSIVRAVKAVNAGGYYLHPKVTGDFISGFNQLRKREVNASFYQTAVKQPFHLLTRREVEVIQLLADGHSNRTLGETLGISEKTVKNHVCLQQL